MQSHQQIAYAGLKTLADMANEKLLPATPFSFTPFAGEDKIKLPADIKATVVYGGAGQFPDGMKVTLWLFAWKMIDGIKTYTWNPLAKAFQPQAGGGKFSMIWEWNDASDNVPDGYLVVIPILISSVPKNTWEFFWQDIGAVNNFSEDGSFSSGLWFVSTGLRQNQNLGGMVPSKDLPCGNGAWTKQLNYLRGAMFYETDILCYNFGSIAGFPFGFNPYPFSEVKTIGPAAIVSGPTCVCVGSKLVAWIARTSLLSNQAVASYTPCFTQCYREIKFYFRNVDALAGINISVRNQLLAFIIGADPIPAFTHTAHFSISLLFCSNGHIKIQDSGGGTVRFESDVVAGNVYDCSFDLFDAVGFNPSATLPKSVDIHFTTAGTNVSVVASGIELNNDVQCATAPDSYFEIQFTNPKGFNAPIQCTSCGQLELTEQNNVPGIWAAMTLPGNGQMTFLDQDLPQYQFPEEISSRRVVRNEALPFMPVVDNRGALWPLYRDTDFIPDNVLGQPFNGSPAWNKSIATKKVFPNSHNQSVASSPLSLAPGTFPIFVSANAQEIRLLVQDPNVIMFLAVGRFPTIADHDAQIAGGAWQTISSADSFWQNDTTWFVRFQNSTAAAINTTINYVEIDDTNSPNGTFFPTQKDDGGNVIPQNEKYSYHYSDPTNLNLLPIPIFGYCIFEIALRRQPLNGIAPSAEISDLAVDIGIMENFGWGAQGNFTKLLSAVIPAGQSEIVIPTFLPVLSGIPLAYQCAEILNARASADFQPASQSEFIASTTMLNGQPFTIGYCSGAPLVVPDQAGILDVDNFTFANILLPISSDIYNDVEAVLQAI